MWEYFEKGGRNGVAVWHRRSGKDEVALNLACVKAHERAGNYWHMLPEYKHARKAIWDAINPHSGRRRIDEAFPLEVRKSINNTEMKIELKCGSIWQLVGSDNFNALIGSPPVGITYSEWAVADPRSHGYLRPILAENGGWSLFIFTSRGYNHGFKTYESARAEPDSFAELLTVDDTKALSEKILESELRQYRAEYGDLDGDSLYRQEYYCDFSAANIGAILGRYVEAAERDGRIHDGVGDDLPIVVSSDIGFRDTAAWWFWQVRRGGFSLVDYDEDRGLDADDWAVRLKEKITLGGYTLRRIWLPHDAAPKTFQSRHSSAERFLRVFGGDKVKIVPSVKVADRINAARVVIRQCEFHKTRCWPGLMGLRGWQFEYDDETRTFSKVPKHDEHSHPGDAFSYGAVVLREEVKDAEPEKGKRLGVGDQNQVSLDDLWQWQQQFNDSGKRI